MAFLAVSAVAIAANLNGSGTQGEDKFGIGFDGEYVFKRKMETKLYPLIPDSGQIILEKSVSIDEMYRGMATLSYGILDNLDIYLKVGTAALKVRSDYKTTWTSNGYELGKLKINAYDDLAYGAGVKGKFNFKYDWILGADFQGLRHRNDFKATIPFTDYNSSGVQIDSGTDYFYGKVTALEWRVAPYIAKKLGNFTPYVGGEYSDIRLKSKIRSTETLDFRFRADKIFGAFCGLDYKISDNLNLNAEGRFLDQTAAGISVNYVF